MTDGYCGPCGHPWDWHGKREDGKNDGACKGGYPVGMTVAPCSCRRKPPVRKLHAAAGNSGYTSVSEDAENIMSDAVDNFYAMQRVQALADRWHNATELGNGQPSVVTRAFADELRRAIEGTP